MGHYDEYRYGNRLEQVPYPRGLDQSKLAEEPREAHATSMGSEANKRQVGGEHYKTGGLEHWDIVHQFQLDYFQGQITKYVMRWRKKNGIQDLKKARHFLDKYIELAEDSALQGTPEDDSGSEPGRGYVDQDR